MRTPFAVGRVTRSGDATVLLVTPQKGPLFPGPWTVEAILRPRERRIATMIPLRPLRRAG